MPYPHADSYVEIDLATLRDNARAVLSYCADYRGVIAVVKGDAYGHGMRAAAAFAEAGFTRFAVSSLEEARELRTCIDADILLLEPVALNRLDEAAELHLTLPICDMDYLRAFIDAAGEYSFCVHMQIDAGFNRLGFKRLDEVNDAIRLLEGSHHTRMGSDQHYATAGINDPYYDEQIARFTALTEDVIDSIPLVHLTSGVTMIAHPRIPSATATRVGLMLYGYNIGPSSYGGGIRDRLRDLRDRRMRKKYRLTPTITDVKLDLKPAMTYRCRILQLKDVKRGEHIGYGAAYTAREDMRIAILPVGYNNGIGHRNNGRVVEISGKLYPVVGEIGMNMTAVWVDDSVAFSDVVTLLGGTITLGRFSRMSGLGLAEVLVAVGRNNERVYIEE